MLVRFNQMPKGEECHPGAEDKVMHAELQIGEGVIMISDGYCSGAPKFSGISISLNLKDKAEAERLFNAVGQGGEVKMPFEKTFWAEGFGMVDDKFGVSWMVNVDAADSPMQ
jgi:PhnB protein